MLGKLEKSSLFDIDKNIVSKFLYLFVMDLVRIPFVDFVTYEATEPRFALPMLNAYIAAFQEKSEGKISHALLKKIHKIAMSHKPGTHGEYKKESNNYPIGLRQYSNLNISNYSATVAGVKQFISQWIDNPQTHSHGIGFEKKDQSISESYGLMFKEGQLLFCHFLAGKRNFAIFDKKVHMPIILGLINNYNYKCLIDILPSIFDNEEMHAKTHELVQKVIDDFEEDIVKAASEDEIIFVICKYVQQINQIHPFEDGNIRTCLILLNKLLRDYNLSLTLVMNPNRLDCCTIEEIVSMVKEGQGIYKKLLESRDPAQFIINANEYLDQLRSFPCPAYDLGYQKVFEEFVNFVILGKSTSSISFSQYRHLFVFSSKTDSVASQLITAMEQKIAKKPDQQQIIVALKKGNYGLAFRNACAVKEPSLVQLMLKFKDALHIDLNEQSSNGNTALDWFEIKTPASDEKTRVIACLIENGAINGSQIAAKSPEP